MMRQPPAYVPSAIAVAAEITTHVGTSKLSALTKFPLAISASVITPMGLLCIVRPVRERQQPGPKRSARGGRRGSPIRA